MAHKLNKDSFEFMKYIGPGLLVAVGFIDPGNWATNIAAGSQFGYHLLWVVTLSTVILVILQHNAAHLGIVSGYCISEAASQFLNPLFSKFVLGSAVLAGVSATLAEILGGAIGLQILFHIPIPLGALLLTATVIFVIFLNGYKKIEKLIIGLVILIGLSFIFELSLVHLPWFTIFKSSFAPLLPNGSLLIAMGVLGAVVMPHNLFLHSEIIQSKQIYQKGEHAIEKELKYEFTSTLFSMGIGWVINASIIILAAVTFHEKGMQVTELAQASAMLRPLLGNTASFVFGFGLLLAGFSSSITAGMGGGTIFAGLYCEPYDIKDIHTKVGILIPLLGSLLVIFFIQNPFQALVISQVLLSVQLPWTIFLQISLTSSKKIMGKYANSKIDKIVLWSTGLFIAFLNVFLLYTWVFKK
jgi:manganese transport protein